MNYAIPFVEPDLRKMFSPLVINNCIAMNIRTSCALLEYMKYPNAEFRKTFGISTRHEIVMKFRSIGITITPTNRFEHVMYSLPISNN